MATVKREVVYCVEQEYQRLLDIGVSSTEADSIVRERRKMVEAELYRYSNSKRVIEALEENIKWENEKLRSVGSPVLSDMPKGPHDPYKATDKMVESIDKIISWERMLNSEQGKNERFEQAWNKLEDNERSVLQYAYGINGVEMLRTEELANKMGYARSHLFRMKFMALDILALCIFGSILSTHPLAGRH